MRLKMCPGPSDVPLSTIWLHLGMHTTVNVAVAGALVATGFGAGAAAGFGAAVTTGFAAGACWACGATAGAAGVGAAAGGGNVDGAVFGFAVFGLTSAEVAAAEPAAVAVLVATAAGGGAVDTGASTAVLKAVRAVTKGSLTLRPAAGGGDAVVAAMTMTMPAMNTARHPDNAMNTHMGGRLRKRSIVIVRA